MKSHKSKRNLVSRRLHAIEGLEKREMFAGDIVSAGLRVDALLTHSISGVIDNAKPAEQAGLSSGQAKPVISLGKSVIPNVVEDRLKQAEPPLKDVAEEAAKDVIDVLPEIAVIDIDLPLDLCDLRVCLPDLEINPDLEIGSVNTQLTSFSIRDASGDNTDDVVFQDGALEYGYQFNGGTPTEVQLVLRKLDAPNSDELVVDLASNDSVNGAFVALPEDMDPGAWNALIRARTSDGSQMTSDAVELQILDTKFARGDFEGDVFLHSDYNAEGLVVLGRGGTDKLVLDGIDYANVVSFNEHTGPSGNFQIDLPIFVEADRGFEIDIDLVLERDDATTVDTRQPLATPADPTNTDLQAIYQGMVFDFLQLSDGREIYFMGIEQLEFDDIGIVDMSITTNDTEFNNQWNLHVTDVPGAWRFSTGSEDVLLVSMDTGVLPGEQGGSTTDLDQSRLITDAGDDDDGSDQYGHGHKAISVMAATPNNSQGIAGINWRSDVLVLDVYGLADEFARDAEDLMLAAEDLGAWAEDFGGDVAEGVNDTLAELENTMQSLGEAITGWLSGEEQSDDDGNLLEDLGNLVGAIGDGIVDVFTGSIEGIQKLGDLIGEAVGLGGEIVEEMDTYLAELSNAAFPLAIIQALDSAAQSGQRLVMQGGVQGESWLLMLENTPWMFEVLETHSDNSFFAMAAGNGNVDIDQVFTDPADESMGLSGGMARLSSEFSNFAAVGALRQTTAATIAGRDNASEVNRAGYSNFGSSLTIMAPTDSLAAELLTDGFSSFGGTSCANPNLASMSSLVWSTNTELTGGEIRQILIDTAMDLDTRGRDDMTGHGLVDTESAIRRAAALGRQPDLAALGDYAAMMQSVDTLTLVPIDVVVINNDLINRPFVVQSNPNDVTSIDELLAGDANRDGKVGFADFIKLSANFGSTNADWEQGDFDDDGNVSFADFMALSSNFGKEAEVKTPKASAFQVVAVDDIFARLNSDVSSERNGIFG